MIKLFTRNSPAHRTKEERHIMRTFLRACILALTLIAAAWMSVGAAPVQLGPLLPNDLVISTATSGSSPAKVAFDGNRYLVIWQQSNNSQFPIHGRFVDTSGALSGAPFVISSGSGGSRSGIAFNGTHYFVVWEANTIKGRVVATNGSLLGSEITIASSSCGNCGLEVASDGMDFLVVWADGNNFSTNAGDILGRRISVDAAGNATPNGGGFRLARRQRMSNSLLWLLEARAISSLGQTMLYLIPDSLMYLQHS